jgi:DnaJ like chaperone protein
MGKRMDQILSGAGIGFLFGGPLGAILGAVMAGSLSEAEPALGAGKLRSQRSVFYANLIILTTLVAKADGKVSRGEARALASFLSEELGFGDKDLEITRRLMKETIRLSPSPEKVARQFAGMATYEERLALLRLVWMIAAADEGIEPPEERIIAAIGQAMGVGAVDQRAVRIEFVAQADGHYIILGVRSDASDEEVKAAFRKMAKQYHPDRVAHLGEEYARLAGEKFAQVAAAYDAVRKERGF